MKDNGYFYLTSTLFGMIGALIITVMMHMMVAPPTSFATVNITGLVGQFVQLEAKRNVPPDQLRREVKQYGATLERELKSFAKQKHLVLLPTEAVIAGAHDYTDQIDHQINVNNLARDN